MTNIAQLRHLLTLAETGSFTRSAALSNRSQAAFSRSIAMLEANLGIPLINRIGHQNDLTPVGRAVLEQARHVLAEVDELHRVVRFQAKGGLGQIKVGLGSTPQALLAVPLLTYAARNHGSLRLRVSQAPADQLLSALRERKLDLLVVNNQVVLPAPDLSIEMLIELKNGLLCRSQHPLSAQDSVSFDEFAKYPVASTSLSDEVARQLVQTYGAHAHPDQLVSLYSEDIQSLLTVVCETDAVFLGVPEIGQKLIAAGKLVQLPFSAPGFTSRFVTVHLKGRTVLPAVSLIRDLTREAVRHLDTYIE